MKRVFLMFLSVLLVMVAMTVPAFATVGTDWSANVCDYGFEYGEGEMVTGRDASGARIYVRYHAVNNKVFPLSEAPEMDYTMTINNVTFSNYIKHKEGSSEDGAGNPITVTQVYIGLNGSMRSTVGDVEFMLSATPGFDFNAKESEGHLADSDLVQYKTNTPYVRSGRQPFYFYLDTEHVRPFTNGGRHMDGTWDAGLTWVFEEDPDHNKMDGTYRKIYPIRVDQGDETYYFQVIVSNDTNFTGERPGQSTTAPTTPTTPMEPAVAPAKEATANPTVSKIYVNGKEVPFDAYNINGNNYFKLRDVAITLRGTEKQFEVVWNPSYKETINGTEVRGAIDMYANKAYTTVGGEMQLGDGVAKHATLTSSPILKDGVKITSLTGYNINGNNYFKLRDLGELFDFNVTWDGARSCIVINTSESYDPSN